MTDHGQLELWGGFECTIVRVGSDFRDQVDDTGHRRRPDDLDRVRALGIRTLRYPALWEAISPDTPDACDWTWQDERLDRLQRLGIRPILGLLHHGSGPRYTNLLDPDFPQLFARHAARVAQRYPWVDAYTPVNEPLTTARFSALYGHWYPHRRDLGDFLRATVHQCKATVLAMRAIRAVRPGAELIQTEDIGKTFSTLDLEAQARYENDRRWLSLDLLCGRVDRHHPWRDTFRAHGVADRDLDLFLDGEGAPDVIGVNHYLTSERFLDGDWHRYPEQFRGGNGVVTYADAEAVRAGLPDAMIGPRARLREVLERFGRPVAVTEAHLGCSREEQLRWLAEVWHDAHALKAEGADVRAVTVWALAGSVDWPSLLTERRGLYEPGAFDVRAPVPRVTALGRSAAALATSGSFDHPTLGRGWWRRPARLYGHVLHEAGSSQDDSAPRLLIGDGDGALATGFVAECEARGLPWAPLPASAPSDGPAAQDRPWAIIDTGGSTADGHAALAAALDIPLVIFSSEAVFDGRLGRPMVEGDEPCPGGLAGARQLARERAATARHRRTLLIRTSLPFGSGIRAGPGSSTMWAGSRFEPGSLVSPTFVPDLVQAVLDLLIDGETGTWHLVNAGSMRWGDAAARLGLAPPAPGPAQESPVVLALASEKAWIMPTLEHALARFARERGDGPEPELQRVAAQ